jgi:hypothetical protein
VLNPDHHHNPEPESFPRSPIIPTALAVAALVLPVLLAMWNAAAKASPRAINGRCGMHIGALVRRNQGGSLYRYRTGPKYHNPRLASRCRGWVRVRRTGSVAETGGVVWRSYSLGGWNEKT